LGTFPRSFLIRKRHEPTSGRRGIVKGLGDVLGGKGLQSYFGGTEERAEDTPKCLKEFGLEAFFQQIMIYLQLVGENRKKGVQGRWGICCLVKFGKR